MIKFSGITFDPKFKKRTQADFDKKQKYVDSEILRLSDQYVPMQTGMLKKSGISGTVIGSGKVEYIAPYGRKQYYENSGKGIEGVNKPGGGLRGKLWFERMKADHKKEILRGLKKIK
ncbi:MAG: minor capsid protein [Lachnospiraceae bacterium]|nr:minor capsid protein [Lachnospiraceae bacterium]MCM1233701.1 minor capsid protein [Ruminococcus flavefaciens]